MTEAHASNGETRTDAISARLIVSTLPPLYALVLPLPRAVLTEWRIRGTLLHRRAYSTAAPCLAYAAASLVFRSALPALGGGAGSASADVGGIPPVVDRQQHAE